MFVIDSIELAPYSVPVFWIYNYLEILRESAAQDIVWI